MNLANNKYHAADSVTGGVRSSGLESPDAAGSSAPGQGSARPSPAANSNTTPRARRLTRPRAASISPRASYCTSYQNAYGEGAAKSRSPGVLPSGSSVEGRPARHTRSGSSFDGSAVGERPTDGGDEQALINRINNVDMNSGAASPPSSPAAPAFSRRGAADARARQTSSPFTRAGVPLPPGSSVPRRNSYVASEASGSSGSGTGAATAGAPGGSDSGGGGGGRSRVTYTPVDGGGVTETVGPGRRVVSGTSVVHRTSTDGRPLTTTGSVMSEHTRTKGRHHDVNGMPATPEEVAAVRASQQGGDRQPADALHRSHRESDTSEDARDPKQRQQQQQQQQQAQSQTQGKGEQPLAGKAHMRSPAAAAPLTPPQRSPYSDKPWPVTAVPASQARKWAYEKYGNKEQKALAAAAAAAPEAAASPVDSGTSEVPSAAAQVPATDRGSSAGLLRPPAAVTQAPAEGATRNQQRQADDPADEYMSAQSSLNTADSGWAALASAPSGRSAAGGYYAQRGDSMGLQPRMSMPGNDDWVPHTIPGTFGATIASPRKASQRNATQQHKASVPNERARGGAPPASPSTEPPHSPFEAAANSPPPDERRPPPRQGDVQGMPSLEQGLHQHEPRPQQQQSQQAPPPSQRQPSARQPQQQRSPPPTQQQQRQWCSSDVPRVPSEQPPPQSSASGSSDQFPGPGHQHRTASPQQPAMPWRPHPPSPPQPPRMPVPPQQPASSGSASGSGSLFGPEGPQPMLGVHVPTGGQRADSSASSMSGISGFGANAATAPPQRRSPHPGFSAFGTLGRGAPMGGLGFGHGGFGGGGGFGGAGIGGGMYGGPARDVVSPDASIHTASTGSRGIPSASSAGSAATRGYTVQTPGGGDGRAGKPSFAPSVAGSAPSGAIPDPHQGPTTGGLSMAPMSPIGPGAGPREFYERTVTSNSSNNTNETVTTSRVDY